MTSELSRTPIFDWHAAHGGRMVDFAGWSMPVQYGSIIQEHEATRNAFGLFDVSHMGRFQFTGADTAQFLDRLTTRRVANMDVGKIRYSLVCNESGGILDDVLVYRLADAEDRPYFSMVVNASNRTKIADWIQTHLTRDLDVQFADKTVETAMIAVQGPHALSTVRSLLDFDAADLAYYNGRTARIGSTHGTVSRTGYTGEDGCELIVPAAAAKDLWTEILDKGQAVGAQAAGLGARDTLRLEAAMPLYGHELSESINPVQAQLQFAINLKDREFIGCQAIREAKADDQMPIRIGLEMEGKRAAREHCPILSGGKQVGEVTSGTFSPTLQKPIAMGYVAPACAEVGTELIIDIRGRDHMATVVQLPFYHRS